MRTRNQRKKPADAADEEDAASGETTPEPSLSVPSSPGEGDDEDGDDAPTTTLMFMMPPPGPRAAPDLFPILAQIRRAVQDQKGDEGDEGDEGDNGGDQPPPRKKARPTVRNPREAEYVRGAPREDLQAIADAERAVASARGGKGGRPEPPLRYQILRGSHPTEIKAMLLKRLEEDGGEKSVRCISRAAQLPLGVYRAPPVTRADPSERVRAHLLAVRENLDREVYGHAAAKDAIMRLVAEMLVADRPAGTVLGLKGPPGVGKSTLVMHGVSHALGGWPVQTIALGGMTDAAQLAGFGYTWEGSGTGLIADALVRSKCMNPVLIFDEADKINAEEGKGREVAGLLCHVTDATQNADFRDRYLPDIPLDLSRAVMCFTFNREIDPILRDRMRVIEVAPYTAAEKREIARRHLLPRAERRYSMRLRIDDATLAQLVEAASAGEAGVRNLDRAIVEIAGQANLARLLETGDATAGGDVTVTAATVREVAARVGEAGGASRPPPGMYT